MSSSGLPEACTLSGPSLCPTRLVSSHSTGGSQELSGKPHTMCRVCVLTQCTTCSCLFRRMHLSICTHFPLQRQSAISRFQTARTTKTHTTKTHTTKTHTPKTHTTKTHTTKTHHKDTHHKDTLQRHTPQRHTTKTHTTKTPSYNTYTHTLFNHVCLTRD